MSELKADCYSAGERAGMIWTQDVRAWLFRPLLILAERCGVRPDHVTAVSLFFGLAFCPLYLLHASASWAMPLSLVSLLLHVLLDGFDGPLARHLSVGSPRGSFTDTFADQLVVTGTTLALMCIPSPPLSVVVGGLYLFFYSMVVGFAMVRNAMGLPYSWLLRPRLWIYGWIAVDYYLLPDTLNGIMAIFSVVLGIKMASGFVAIRRLL